VTLFEFFYKESESQKNQIFMMALFSGISSGLLLALINAGAETVSHQEDQARFFLLYIVSFILYIYTQRFTLSQTIIAFEEAIRRVRIRIADKIRRTDLLFIEGNERGEIHTGLTQGSSVVSGAAIPIVSSAQSAIVLAFNLVYIAWLSFSSFLLISLTISSALFWHLATRRKIAQELQEATLTESRFFNMLSQILDGFKEIKVNQRKSDDLFQQVKNISVENENLKVKAGIQSISLVMFSRVMLYLLLALIVFIIPIFNSAHTEIIFKLTASVLFIMGPVNIIIFNLPILARAHVALKNLYALESKLDTVISKDEQTETPIVPPTLFKEIRLSEISFDYVDQQGNSLFSLGPINLTIQPGELLFIVGGNGSGKSTLLKLLAGLYHPSQGSLYRDDEEIDQTNYQSYREFFSVVFADFHLFDKLYGLSEAEVPRLKSLLREMELDKKTKYVNGRFTHLDLSQGQRKRLAFIVAVLENKPIYIFDELAADQDPRFRKYFYEIVLKDLKQQGKTLIVVSHDDRYFHIADRLLKMEYGQLVNHPENS